MSQPGLLRYTKGDATMPHGASHRMIIHCCNDIGGFGKGFAAALAARYPKAEQEYRLWYRSQIKFKLGEIQVVNLQSDLSVVNMIAQHGIYPENGVPPIRWDALEECLKKVAKEALGFRSSIHCPRICVGLASGVEKGYDEEAWKRVESMLVENLVNKGINVTVYDLEKK